MNRCSELLSTALSYARREWAVFPLHTIRGGGCSCFRHQSCGAIAKHPAIRGWQHKATTNEKAIAWWWRKTPYNVAIATGLKSHLVVLDVDDKNGKCGSKTLVRLMQEHEWSPRTLTAMTGNGRHLYFRYPTELVRTQIEGLGEGLDVKGDGGYVVAPPSYHVSFRHYKWDVPTSMVEELPRWLVELLTSKRSTEIVPARSMAKVPLQKGDQRIEEGTRNVTLFRRACAMRGRGYERYRIEAELLPLNASCCNPPLPDDEVRRIAAKAAGYQVGITNIQKH